MERRPFHVGCEWTGLGICYCLEGTPEHLRDKEAAETYCQKAQEIAELWSALSGIDEVPEETQVLLPVLFKRKANSKQVVEVEGLKAAQEEVDNARMAAERICIKAAKKANALGIPNTLLEDLGLHEGRVGKTTEETIQQKMDAVQSQKEEIRKEMRQLEIKRDQMGTQAEREAKEIGDQVDQALHQLQSIKNKLPPDRANEANAVEEAANMILGKARKTRRKQRKLLTMEDVSDMLTGTWLSVFWPGDNEWWNVFVQSVNKEQLTATLLYETGIATILLKRMTEWCVEEAEEVNLKQLVEKGEVAWLDIPITEPSSKRRKKHVVSSP